MKREDELLLYERDGILLMKFLDYCVSFKTKKYLSNNKELMKLWKEPIKDIKRRIEFTDMKIKELSKEM